MSRALLDPQVRTLLETFPAPALDVAALTAAEARARFPVPNPPHRPLPVVIADTVLATSPPLAARTYTPAGAGPFPITLYCHGGGFVLGSPTTTDAICRALAHRAQSVVVSLDYRLAPEAPFPAAFDDTLAALAHLHAGAPIAIAGDSSGGTLAAAAALAARAHGIDVCHQLLLYPPLDAACETPSYQAFARGYLLTADMMRWYWRQYLADPRDAGDPRAAPLRARDLRAAPPATIALADCDPLRDDGLTYARALAAAGVAVEVQLWPGQIHGLFLLQGAVDAADRALAAAGDALRRAFEARP
jgi:acetyl esterase